MVNRNKLRAAIVSKGFTQKEIAKELNINPRTFSLKMKKGVFGSDEIEKILTILEIQDPITIITIFFDNR